MDSSAPSSVKWKAINYIHLRNRASEEQTGLQEDIRNIINHFTDLHAHLVSAADDASSPGLKALAYKRLAHKEIIMADVWKVVSSHVPFLPTMPSMCNDKEDTLIHDTELILDTPEDSAVPDDVDADIDDIRSLFSDNDETD
jgi:hypothetical protein